MTGKVIGKVVEITADGDLVTDISADQLASAPRGESTTVTCDEHSTVGLHGPGHQEPPMTFVAVLDPSGCLKLVIVGDSAKIMLGVRKGAEVEVAW